VSAEPVLPSASDFKRLILAALEELGGKGMRRAIIARAVELGRFSEGQMQVPATHGRYPSHVEYRLSWALTNLKRDGLVVNPGPSVWALATHPLAIAEAPQPSLPDADAERVRQLRAMPYKEYLRTPEWRARRQRALEAAEHRCQLDRRHSGNLDVHHNTYERRGEERPGDLIVLCRGCHRKHHFRKAPSQAEVASVAPPAAKVRAPEATTASRSRRRGRSWFLLPIVLVIAALVVVGFGATAPDPSGASPAPATRDVDCASLSPREAQRVLRADPSDPNRLDADHDGRACDVG
jgi:hypothetical protein